MAFLENIFRGLFVKIQKKESLISLSVQKPKNSFCFPEQSRRVKPKRPDCTRRDIFGSIMPFSDLNGFPNI